MTVERGAKMASMKTFLTFVPQYLLKGVSMSNIIVRREREWLVPCIVMTAALALAAVTLRPASGVGSGEFFLMFPMWATYVLIAEISYLAFHLIKMMRAGVASPLVYFRHEFDWRRPAILGFAALLSGFNMICFMWIKAEINLINPFYADQGIANIGRFIFGRDPWRFFEGMDLTFMALTYNVLWFWALMITLFILLFAKPSAGRSASLISYFFLWSLFGPIGQYLVPAAGPIFYGRIGLGDRYDGLHANIPAITRDIANYLWSQYSHKSLGLGAGISSMPSLHIATATWMVISLKAIRSRLTIPVAVLGLYLFVASVALGWHYFLDGVVGALGAMVGHQVGLAYVNRYAEKPSAPANPAIAGQGHPSSVSMLLWKLWAFALATALRWRTRGPLKVEN